MKPLPALEKKMLGLGYVTTSAAAARTSIGKSTINDAIRAGKIDTKRVGNRWFVQVESFLSWAGDGARDLWKESGPVEVSKAASGKKRKAS